MQDRTDPHARQLAFEIARKHSPAGVSPEAAALAVAEVLDGTKLALSACPKTGTDNGLFGSGFLAWLRPLKGQVESA
ncbi:hypothetical protein [Bradyrhizobium vignae]|uniref:hypothetical protein n=1 Tax=Bradyrhizobium vignae TaxID=1549949 RepID=UPI002897EE10|nr:hypothetical protein [Bradyrhizobium vignae]